MRKIIDVLLMIVIVFFCVPGFILAAIGTSLYGLVSPWGEQAVYKFERFIYE